MNLVRQTQTVSRTLTRGDQEGAQSVSTILSLGEVALLDIDDEPLLDLDDEPLTDIGAEVLVPISFTTGEVMFTTSGVMLVFTGDIAGTLTTLTTSGAQLYTTDGQLFNFT